jgi:hypothetical protein
MVTRKVTVTLDEAVVTSDPGDLAFLIPLSG